MDKNKVTGLTIGAILIVIVCLLLLYFFHYRGGPQPNLPAPGTPSGPTAVAPPAAPPVAPPAAQTPAAIPAPQELAPQKPPGAPAPSELGPQKPAAPPLEQAGPAKGVAPGAEVTPPAPKVTVVPPKKEKKYYGFLVNRYRNYGSASKMQEKMKKRGVFGFIQPAPNKPGLHELWAGPFSDLDKARAAEKSLRDLLKGPRKIHQIKGTVPK
jgi:cell division septation protein DedD